MLFNYTIGNTLNKETKFSKRSILTFAILANLALLGYFKYADFFIENFNFALNMDLSLLHLALPLAISFFTFQQIAYLVDSYRGETAEYDFLNYALFVTFFPQLIAGPIVHHKEIMPQFASKWKLVKRYKNIALGIFIFSMGLFKKVVIADTFATWATNGFDKAETLNMIEAWATSLSYTFQLYFDFSGYTDMAIGVALLFNIKLPANFNSPYKALNIQDFWRRWHITLSNFLRDYIYIPLGGSQMGNFKTYSNLMITFLLGGMWHGAGWTFIFWGFLHGFGLIVHRAWSSLGIKMHTWFAWLITFNFINISWIFFRAKEFDDAIKVLKNMFFGELILPSQIIDKLPFSNSFQHGVVFFEIDASRDGILWLIGSFIVVLALKNSSYYITNFKVNKKTAIITYLFLLVSLMNFTKVSEFLYFNF
jgi:D-alanyl-lipoteichoic acid acyltransferase DltB (MBOAT superfamily)